MRQTPIDLFGSRVSSAAKTSRLVAKPGWKAMEKLSPPGPVIAVKSAASVARSAAGRLGKTRSFAVCSTTKTQLVNGSK